MYYQTTSVAISPFIRVSLYCVSCGDKIEWFTTLKEAKEFSLILCENNFYKSYKEEIIIKEYRLEL